jgi:hypothetical protein
LGVAGASRFYRIDRFDRMHGFTSGTRNNSATSPQDISKPLSKIPYVSYVRGWRRRSPSILIDSSLVQCSVCDPRYIETAGVPMRALGATTVASIILYFADQFVYDGRYTQVLTGMLRQVGWLVGVHV